MLHVILIHEEIDFPTWLLLDSGSDFSMLRREIVEDGLEVDIEDLEEAGTTCGITGETRVAVIDVNLIFGLGSRYEFVEKNLPFQVPLEEEKNPPISLIGRDPFFYNYRVSFRMGYTDDPELGKFVIYEEEKKRPASRYKRPFKITKDQKIENYLEE